MNACDVTNCIGSAATTVVGPPDVGEFEACEWHWHLLWWTACHARRSHDSVVRSFMADTTPSVDLQGVCGVLGCTSAEHCVMDLEFPRAVIRFEVCRPHAAVLSLMVTAGHEQRDDFDLLQRSGFLTRDPDPVDPV